MGFYFTKYSTSDVFSAADSAFGKEGAAEGIFTMAFMVHLKASTECHCSFNLTSQKISDALWNPGENRKTTIFTSNPCLPCFHRMLSICGSP